jgi:hypothetical protein
MLEDLVVPPNAFLFTYDAVAMYANIQARRSIEIVCEHIRRTAHQFTNHVFPPTTQKIILIKKMNIMVQGIRKSMGQD